MATSISLPDRFPDVAANSSVIDRMQQGHSSGTILTNDSKNMTVIKPFNARKPVTAPSLDKGTRWMHRSTLTMERNPCKSDFNTSTQKAFSGSKRLGGAQRPTPCPTLHSSHFDVGVNRQLYHDTHYKTQFPQHNYEHPNKLHYQSITNWTHNVVGTEMQDVLSRQGHKPDYWSSYGVVHNKLGLQRGVGAPRDKQLQPTYNILTGQQMGVSQDRDLHLVSRNRVLGSIRADPQQSFILS